MRTFLAINLPDEIKKYAEEVRQHLSLAGADVKWVGYNNYHLTVKFLGDINNTQANEIKRTMHTVGDNCPPFALQVGGIGFFPNQFHPRVIWLGVEGDLDKAVFLGHQVDEYLYPLEFKPEKSHRFHLTLGRIRSDRSLNKMLEKISDLEGRRLNFRVNEFKLMESKLLPSGAVYSVLDSFVLNG